MNAGQPKTADEMRISAKEFDRIMGQALQVKPATEKKPKVTKAKTASKKKIAG